MARWLPPSHVGGAAPARTQAQEEGRPSIEVSPLPGLGDRDGAIYTRTFLVPRSETLKPFEAARQAAEDAGWRMDYPDYITANSPPDRTWTSVRGRKELRTGDALITITLDTAPPLSRAGGDRSRDGNSLVIMLEHTR
jgi:hypothetical protein